MRTQDEPRTKPMPIGRAPMGKRYRVSSDAVWPLRRADGTTWAEARKEVRDAL